MQQEAKKNNKKLIWLIAAVVVLLVVAGVVAAVFLMKPAEQAQQVETTAPLGGRPALYWNVDRQLYLGNAESAGLSTREPGEDGLYHLRFAFNGELVEYTIADKRLVNVIDNMDVAGLIFDDAGNVIDAVNPNTIATEVAKDFFVQRIEASQLLLNSSIVMNGMEMPVKLSDMTEVYNVSNTATVTGEIDELELMDKVVVYANKEGDVTHIFIVARQATGIIGWRVDRKQFDTKTQHSTRLPDENGIWNITLAVKGEHKVFKCKDQAIVDNIDKRATYAADLAVRLDEDGFIVEVMEPSVAMRGKLAGASYHITSLDGNNYTATYMFSGKLNGKSFSGTITEDTEIYNVCYGGTGAYIGEPTQLQMEDRVIVYTDLEGNPKLIFVTFRKVNVPVGFSKTRMWDSTKLETSRVPNASGYYTIEMAVEGKLRTLRTKDKAVVNLIDSKSHQMAGLELDGDIIVKAYDPHYVCGDDTYGAGGRRYIKEITGVIVSWVTVGYDFNAPTNLVMRPDAKVYDVTGYPGTKFGAETTLQVGDMVRPLVDYNSNITHLYVISRYTGAPVHYNLSRKYDETKAESTRVPDADGYYVFDLASEGKRFTAKTKSKEMADFIDMQYAPVVSLDVDKEGIIRGAYPVDASYKFGYKNANWNWFVKYNEDGTIVTTSYSRATEYTLTLAKNVKIYNVSSIVSSHKGEPTNKLMPNDLIQAVALNDTKEIVEIYVITRQVESKFYYNITRKYNTTTKETTRVPDAEGYYVFDLSVEGKTKQFKTKSKEIATTIDSYGYVPFGMQVDGDIIKTAFSASSILGVQSTACSQYDVSKISGTDLTVTAYLPTLAKVGESLNFKLAKNYKAYNVSAYAEPFGAKVKLAPGDRIRAYTNTKGEVEWIWIWQKNTHQKGHISYCEHCGKDVYWQPYVGASYAVDTHVYVTNNGQTVSQVNISSKDAAATNRPELIIDLNGYTLTPRGRAFLTYGTLSIVDTVGGGKIMANKTATDTTQALMSSTGGVINLYSGTITRNPNNKAGSNGGVVFIGADSTFNMYGGTIEGGFATQKGGNVYTAYGTFNMYGGKITGGVNGAGKNVYIGGGTFNMEGGTIDGDVCIDNKNAVVNITGNAVIKNGTEVGISLPSGLLLDLSKFTANNKIVVDAAGVFTTEVSNPSAYLDRITSSTTEMPVVVAGKALACGKLQYCPHCEQEVYFGKFTTGGCTGSTHLLVTSDMTLANQLQIGTSGSTDDVVIDLNGHTITTETGTNAAHDTGRFALVYATLTLMDNSAAGDAKIIAAQAYNTGGVIMVATTGKLNLYGGELTLAEDCGGTKGGVVSVGSGTFNMYGGKISNGRIQASATSTSSYLLGGNIFVGAGTFNMYDGEVVGGGELEPDAKILLGGNICVQGGKVNIYGGTVSGGVADLGGNIFADDKSKVNVLGGTVKDGVALVKIVGEKTYELGNGGNIYADQESVITIGADDGSVETLVTGGQAHQGGNIYQVTKSTVNVGKLGTVSNGQGVKADSVDEKYTGGNFYLGESAKLNVRGTVSGGKAWQGGNIAANGMSEITVDGGLVSGGTIDGWNGGSIQSNNGVVRLINGATVTGGKANRYRGGNIYAGGGAELYISNSTVSNGSAWQGGNIFVSTRTYLSGGQTKVDYGIVEITDGAVISGGVTNITDNYSGGGNICALGAQITVNGSTIENGVSKSCGGNIFITNMENNTDVVSSLTIDKDSKILGGDAQKTAGYNGGGNIYAAGNTVIDCAGTIADGLSGRFGGNVMLSHATLNLLDGAKVEDGTATAMSGGNICKFNSGAVNVEAGATISGGTAGTSGSSIYITGDNGNGVLNIAGTVTGGEVLVGNAKVDATVSGAAKIDYLSVNSNAKINLGELTTGADIKVNGSGAFTVANEKASEYVGYFHGAEAGMDVAVNENNELVVGALKYCEHCQQNVLFGPFTAGTHMQSVHMIVSEETLLNTQLTIGSTTAKDMEVVVELNGNTVRANTDVTNEYQRFALVYGKLFIQDSVGGGKIIGNPTTQNAGAIMVGTGGELTIYGGEISTVAGSAAAKTAGTVSVGAGKFTMNGGTIIGGLVKDHCTDLNYSYNMGGAVYVTSGTFVMNGGTIIGSEADASATKPLSGGAIYNATGKVTINGGTVTGGEAALGGSIYNGGTLTINGGTIENGIATPSIDTTKTGASRYVDGLGGTIYQASGAKLTIGDSNAATPVLISGGRAYRGGNIYIADATNTVTINTDATVQNGETVKPEDDCTTHVGGNIYTTESVKLNILGTVTGGKAYQGGNITASGLTALNVNGGTISNGTAVGWSGGNIQANNADVTVQNGATVSGGKATGYRGGNIYAGGGATVLISNATVSGGKAWQGGNIFVASRLEGTKFDVGTVTLNEGAVITGGEATAAEDANGGGNIYSEGGRIVATNATIKDGVSAGSGGNILGVKFTKESGGTTYTLAPEIVIAAGTTVENGTANKANGYSGGGNIYICNGGKLDVYGTVKDGNSKRYGGNVMMNVADVTLYSGAVVEGGVSTSVGGDFCKFGAGTLEVKAGAAIKGGTALNQTAKYGSGIYASGGSVVVAGTVGGHLAVDSTGNAVVTVSGAAKINLLGLPTGDDANAKFNIVLNELVDGAEINVIADGNFTVENDKAYAYAKYFHAAVAGKGVAVNGKVLMVGNAEACAHCGEGKTAVFTPFNAGNVNGNVHMRLQSAVTIKNQLVIPEGADVVIDLNGFTATTEEGTNAGNDTGRFARVLGKLSIMDSSAAGTGKIVANQKKNTGGVILMATSGEFNLYSGELTLAEGAAATKYGGIVSVSAAKFNMYGGKLSGGKLIDSTGGTAYTYNMGASVYVTTGEFNMYGGEVVGGKIGAANQKNLLGGNIYSAGGTINIEKGTVSGGEASVGGNIYAYGGTVTISKKATVTGGKATGSGGNIYVEGKCVLTVDNATVSNGEGTAGGNIQASGITTKSGTTITGYEPTVVNIVNKATISGGKATSTSNYSGGGNISSGSGAKIRINDATVENGEAAKCGGNMLIGDGELILEAGAVVKGGKATQLGGNICKFNSGKLDLQAGATVEGAAEGVTAGNGTSVWINNSSTNHNLEAEVILAGTVTGGEVWIGGSSDPLTATLADDVKLEKLGMASSVKVVLKDITEKASVVVAATGAFTVANDKAGTYAAQFSAFEADTKKITEADGVLSVVAK